MGRSTFGKSNLSQTSATGYAKTYFGGGIGFKGDLRAQRPAPGKTDLYTSRYSGYGGDNMTGYGPNAGAQRSSYSMKNPTQSPYNPATSPKPAKISAYEAATTAAKKRSLSSTTPTEKKVAPAAKVTTPKAKTATQKSSPVTVPVKQTAYQQQQARRVQENVGPKRSAPSTSRSTSTAVGANRSSGGYNSGGRPTRGRNS